MGMGQFNGFGSFFFIEKYILASVDAFFPIKMRKSNVLVDEMNLTLHLNGNFFFGI